MSRRACALIVVALLLAAGEGRASSPLPELVRRTKPAVVTLLAYDPDKAMPGIGTGFFVAPDQVLSARHVLAGAHRAEVRTPAGETLRVLGISADDPTRDLVLMQVQPPAAPVKPLSLARDIPAEGEEVFAIGSPLGLEWSVSQGIVSAVRDVPGAGRLIQHTAPTSPGSSGCPIMNLRGEVVGIQSSMVASQNKVVQAGQSLNSAVSSTYAAALKPGKLRTLAECAAEIPGDWTPPITSGADAISLRPLVRDDFRGALPFFEEATRRLPEEPDAWFRLGVCRERLGDLERASEAYRKAIALDPNAVTARNNLGVVYSAQKRYGDAAAVLEQAVRLKPDYAEARANLASVWINLARYQDAAAMCREAIRIRSGCAEAHYQLGVALWHLGDQEQAQQEQKTLAPLDPALAERLQTLLKGKPQ